MEIAWARAYDVPVVLVMEPEGNIHEHVILNECVTYRLSSLVDAIQLVAAILLPSPVIQEGHPAWDSAFRSLTSCSS